MPKTRVVFYSDGNDCPVLEWMGTLPARVQAKAYVRIERLADMGRELRRPEADYLRDGIYELRWRFQSQNFRILYFFHGRDMVVLAHGLTKEDRVPDREITHALYCKKLFETDPDKHTYEEMDQ